MQTLYNATTGQSVEWNGTLEDFYAASGADQAGQWATESAAEEIPLTLVPVELEPEPTVEPAVESSVEVHTDAQTEGATDGA